LGKYEIHIDEAEMRPAEEGPKRGGSVWKTVAVTSLITVAVVALFSGVAGYLYWQHLKTTPQYSLALIVNAARQNDQATITQLIDIDSVVDDFVPQITGKAVELYGRGLAPDIIQRIARIAAPVMPAVKERAREELPGAIRQRTAGLSGIPFSAMVLGADQYLDIRVEGDTATVRSREPDHNFEFRMVRAGSVWKIAAVKDDELATRIAQRIGQEVVAIAVNGPGSARSRLGVKNINEVLREAEEIFK
jgi:hypothetical protein